MPAASRRPRVRESAWRSAAAALAGSRMSACCAGSKSTASRSIVLAGTSMGGLIGGSYATGMTPDEIEAMLAGIDWNAMFGDSDFRSKRAPQARLAAPTRHISSSV